MRSQCILACLLLISAALFLSTAAGPAVLPNEAADESCRDADGIRVEALKYGSYVQVTDGIWDIDSASDFYVYFDFQPDPATIEFWIYSVWEKRDNNQDGLLDGNWTYYPGNRTLHFVPDHRMFYQRLQNIPEYTLYIGAGLRTAQGDPVLAQDFNLSFKIEELNSDGDDMPDYRDSFPYDPTQWVDSDADGYGDNQSGNNPDRFPSDVTQWVDTDGDGHGDNASGHLGDQFPEDPAAWEDTDGDGMPDDVNSSMKTTLKEDDDDDNDGVIDEWELDLETDPKNNRSVPPDLDQDGLPDGKDPDIDGDGFSNKEEENAGTDPYDPEDHPTSLKLFLIIAAVVIVLLIITVPVVWYFVVRRKPEEPGEGTGRVSRRPGGRAPRSR